MNDVPLVPEELLEALNEPCPFTEVKEKGSEILVSETHVLVLIPKGMTLNKMGELAKEPIEGHKTEYGYEYYWDMIEEKYGTVEVKDSYWVLMTKNLIPNSREKTRQEQLNLAASVKGYGAPSLIEAAVCNFVSYVSTGKGLLSKDKKEDWIYTCCREEPIKDWKLVVGGFTPAGLIVCDSNDCNDDVGVAGARRK